MAKPDDISSKMIYEVFNFPSRSMAGIHMMYGVAVLAYTFFALY